MPAVATGDDNGVRQVAALERELEQARGDQADAWGRYHALRRRKIVRAALALASAPRRARELAGRAPAPPARDVVQEPAPAVAPEEPTGQELSPTRGRWATSTARFPTRLRSDASPTIRASGRAEPPSSRASTGTRTPR